MSRINKNIIIHDFESKLIGVKKAKRTYVNIECKICNYKKLIRVSQYIKYSECTNCNNRVPLTLEKVKSRSIEIHGDKFIIHNLDFRKDNQGESRSFIDIECIDCNNRWWVSTNKHINRGQGCGGKCKQHVNRKYQVEVLKSNSSLADQKYKLYFVRFIHKITNDQFYKVGKTCKTINQRFSGKEYSNYLIEQCQVVEGTHLWVAEQEDIFINKYKKYKYNPNESFSGYTECFNQDIVKEF